MGQGMNTPTPETDAEMGDIKGDGYFSSLPCHGDYVPSYIAAKLERERDQLRIVCDELAKLINQASNTDPDAGLLDNDGYTMSYHLSSPLHVDMIKAIALYNTLPHVNKYGL